MIHSEQESCPAVIHKHVFWCHPGGSNLDTRKCDDGQTSHSFRRAQRRFKRKVREDHVKDIYRLFLDFVSNPLLTCTLHVHIINTYFKKRSSP